jgi:hypothetical protein
MGKLKGQGWAANATAVLEMKLSQEKKDEEVYQKKRRLAKLRFVNGKCHLS